MGLNGLKKNETNKKAEDFINGAKQRANANTPKKETFQRSTFSLDKSTNRAIDELTIIHPDYKLNRSDIVRLAITLLANMDKEKLIAEYDKYKL